MKGSPGGGLFSFSDQKKETQMAFYSVPISSVAESVRQSIEKIGLRCQKPLTDIRVAPFSVARHNGISTREVQMFADRVERGVSPEAELAADLMLRIERNEKTGALSFRTATLEEMGLDQ